MAVDELPLKPRAAPAPTPTNRWLVLLAAFCGIVNNASFCVLLGASQEMANEFGQSKFQPLIINISTLGSVLGVFVSSKLMVGRMSDASRLGLVVLGNLVGYALIALAYRVAPWDASPRTEHVTPSWGFWLCTVGALVLGFTQSSGEVLNLGVYRAWAPSMLAGWGAGTGLSGIVGPFLFIAMHSAFGLDVGNVAVVMIAFLPFYLAALRLIMRRGDAVSARSAALPAHEGGGGAPEELEAPPGGGLVDGGGDEGGACAQESFSLANLRVVWRTCRVVLANMVAVYSLEYMVTSGFLQAVTQCAPTSSWLANSDNNNPLLWAMYNVGVTFSRASVSCFRIRRVWLLTLLQAANCAAWALLAFTQWLARAHADAPLYAAAAHMVFVGFMGGAAYANCMYLFNTSASIPERYRELGINMGFLFSNLGIISATGLVVLLKSTVMSKHALFPPHGECPAPG